MLRRIPLLAVVLLLACTPARTQPTATLNLEKILGTEQAATPVATWAPPTPTPDPFNQWLGDMTLQEALDAVERDTRGFNPLLADDMKNKVCERLGNLSTANRITCLEEQVKMLQRKMHEHRAFGDDYTHTHRELHEHLGY